MIGALRQRLRLEAPSRSDADGGAAIVTWADAGSVWAEIKPLSGREIAVADGIVARVSHEVRLRYRAGVRTDMRFVGSGGRVLEIHSIQDVGERRRWLVCHCEERVP